MAFYRMFSVNEHALWSTSTKVHEKMSAHIKEKTSEKLMVYIVSENDKYMKTEAATNEFSLIQKKQFTEEDGKGKYEFEIKFKNL